jgi:DNA-binding NtrC family response regulator
MAKKTVLVVDDELGAQESFRMILQDEYAVLIADDGEAALAMLTKQPIDLVLLDVIMPGMDGLETLRNIRKTHARLPVIMVTATKTIRTVVEAMRMGALDYVTKPFNVDEIKDVVKKVFVKQEVPEEETARKPADETRSIIGDHQKMLDVQRSIERVAGTDSNILIIGESGTGKELVARAIHYTGTRKNGPFIAVNAASISESLLESELFGHEKGAFTGAIAAKKGTFEMAHKGTLFLDEIIDTSPALQAKLLRVLQEKEFRRVGGTELIKVDVRLIAATNKDLFQAVKEGKFREDLYYRVAVVPIELPPLRDRKTDIPRLVDYFFKQFSKKIRSEVKMFSDEAVESLMNYDWPGNVRELQNFIERLLVTVEAETIYAYHLPPQIRLHKVMNEMGFDSPMGEMSLEGTISKYEKKIIEDALERNDGILSSTAEYLGTTRRILKYKMDKLGINSRLKNGLSPEADPVEDSVNLA